MSDQDVVAPAEGLKSEALLKAIFDAADIVAGVFELLDDDYRYVIANTNAAAFYGKPPGGLDGLKGRDLGLTGEQIEARLVTLREAWRTGQTRTAEYPFEIEGGKRGWFFGTFSPIPGDRPWVSFVVLDVTERRRAQVEALRQGARLAVALDATALGLWEYDVKSDAVDWDPRMRSLFGAPADGPIDFATYAAAVHPDDFPMVEAAYLSALTGANDGAYVVEHRTTAAGAGGSAKWIRGAARVTFNADGSPRRVIGTAQDITSQVESRDRQNLLLAELNHRVKNNLAAVQAIANHTLRGAADPADFRRAFEDRLMSLARGHDLLTRNAWQTAALEEVFDAALSPFATQAIGVSGEGGGARVKPDLAVNLVMVLNELATNAGKYGALSTPAGAVTIEWSVAAGRLEATWRERGGPAVVKGRHEGFGSRLMRSALSAFGGKIEVSLPAEGLICEISVPVEV